MFLNHITYISAERQWQGFERRRSQLSNKKKSDKPHSVCRQKIMLTWKVALVLLIFALSLTELNPHSSSLFGIASEMEVIDAWAGIFLIFFLCVLFTIFCFPSEHLSGYLFFFYIFSPFPHQDCRSQSSRHCIPVPKQTAGVRKSSPCPRGNPSS